MRRATTGPIAFVLLSVGCGGTAIVEGEGADEKARPSPVTPAPLTVGVQVQLHDADDESLPADGITFGVNGASQTSDSNGSSAWLAVSRNGRLLLEIPEQDLLGSRTVPQRVDLDAADYAAYDTVTTHVRVPTFDSVPLFAPSSTGRRYHLNDGMSQHFMMASLRASGSVQASWLLATEAAAALDAYGADPGLVDGGWLQSLVVRVPKTDVHDVVITFADLAPVDGDSTSDATDPLAAFSVHLVPLDELALQASGSDAFAKIVGRHADELTFVRAQIPGGDWLVLVDHTKGYADSSVDAAGEGGASDPFRNPSAWRFGEGEDADADLRDTGLDPLDTGLGLDSLEPPPGGCADMGDSGCAPRPRRGGGTRPPGGAASCDAPEPTTQDCQGRFPGGPPDPRNPAASYNCTLRDTQTKYYYNQIGNEVCSSGAEQSQTNGECYTGGIDIQIGPVRFPLRKQWCSSTTVKAPPLTCAKSWVCHVGVVETYDCHYASSWLSQFFGGDEWVDETMTTTASATSGAFTTCCQEQ